MKLLFAALSLACAAWSQPVELNLMPMPAKVELGQGRLAIGPDFCIAASPFVKTANLLERLTQRTKLKMKGSCSSNAKLDISVKRPRSDVQNLGESERYTLQVTPAGAKLIADNALGALRGMQTFYQLVMAEGNNWYAPAVTIEDAPRFPWRGLHMDVSRHWMPKEVVLRNLDGMAAVKMNVFHWHLSDDQGFRIESKRYPKLHELGSDGNYYTQQQVREVLDYARERGIRVVPEFDVPAHSSAWLVGYPELGSGPGPYQIGRKWGIFEPTLDPTNEAVYTFLDGFIGEMAALFPDAYFHIGGDEVNGKQWNTNPQIVAFKKAHGMANNQALQAYFNQRLQTIVKKHGKRMEGWDEILDPALPKDIVIQSWRGQHSLAQAARMGYEDLLSAPYYLDAMKPASEYYLADPLEGESSGLSPEESKRVLGGEVCTWSEFLTPENIDSRIWPRTAAVAERLWSPQPVKDVSSMYRRLEAVSRELELLGLTHISNYRMMLARLAGPQALEPMTVLADVVRPVNLGGRQRGHNYTQQTPLNRLCDIAQPESQRARAFAGAVDQSIAGKAGRDEVRHWLTVWRDNDAKLNPSGELAPVSANLKLLATAGLQALDALESGRKLQQRPAIEAAGKPQAEVIIAIAPAVQKLVDAAENHR